MENDHERYHDIQSENRTQFANELAAFSEVRREITEHIPAPRRVLYIGMHTAWTHPLTTADGHEIAAVDPAYRGLYIRPDDREGFLEALPESVLKHELDSFLMDRESLTTLQQDMSGVLGQGGPVAQEDGAICLSTTWRDRERTYRLIPETAEDYLAKNPGEYDVLLLMRTFPSVSTWAGLLSHLETGGYVYGSGFGSSRGRKIEETLSGSGIVESSLPLYFYSETVGLKKQQEGTLALYKKICDADPAVSETVIRAGALLDQLLYLPDVTDIFADISARDELGNIIEFTPYQRKEIPLFWEKKQLEHEIERILAPLTGVVDNDQMAQALVGLLNASNIRLQLLEDNVQYEALLNLNDPYFQAAGYIQPAESIGDHAKHYLRRLDAAIISRLGND